MNNKTDIDVQYVSPLKKILMTIGELPTSYLETMSYYEMLVWFTEFLKNKVIPTVNNNAEAVQELQTLYEELRQYVNNYFDNLDVQDEINNKLDEMAESGELTDIIAQYLGLAGMIVFNTVADMKLAENLVNGSKCQTLGYHNVNDGGNAIYKVRNITNSDTVDEGSIIALHDDNLIAELVTQDSVNPDQFGSYGDGTTNDTQYIQNCINFAIANNLKVIFSSNKIYSVTSIDITSSMIPINFNNCTIKARTETTVINLNPSSYSIETPNPKFENLIIDMNNIATKGLYTRYCWRKKFENITINNAPADSYGIHIDGGPSNAGNFYNNITGSNDEYAYLLYITAADNTFSNVSWKNYAKGIYIGAFATLSNIHGFINSPTLYPNSVFIEIHSGAMINNIYSDTQKYAFKHTSESQVEVLLNNLVIAFNTTIVPSQYTDSDKPIIFNLNYVSIAKNYIINNMSVVSNIYTNENFSNYQGFAGNIIGFSLAGNNVVNNLVYPGNTPSFHSTAFDYINGMPRPNKNRYSDMLTCKTSYTQGNTIATWTKARGTLPIPGYFPCLIKATDNTIRSSYLYIDIDGNNYNLKLNDTLLQNEILYVDIPMYTIYNV